MFLPLKNNNSILIQTKNGTLWLVNTLLFPQYGVRVSNQISDGIFFGKCRYNPQTWPLCPIFILNDIIKFTSNTDATYDEIAKYGGIIVIHIDWRCTIKGWIYNDVKKLHNCIPQYSFLRVDNFTSDESTSYRFAHYFNGRSSRMHFRSYRITFKAIVKATVERIDHYKFITSLFAYIGAFTVISFVSTFILKRYMMRQDLDNVIDINIENMLNDELNGNEGNNQNNQLNSDTYNYGTIDHNGLNNSSEELNNATYKTDYVNCVINDNYQLNDMNLENSDESEPILRPKSRPV